MKTPPNSTTEIVLNHVRTHRAYTDKQYQFSLFIHMSICQTSEPQYYPCYAITRHIPRKQVLTVGAYIEHYFMTIAKDLNDR